jgi:Nucleotide modification associated domain 1
MKLLDKTAREYREVIAACKGLFEKKTRDYGTAWRVLRLPSITDQIFIKAQRIRTIEEKGVNLVEEAIENEFVGIINYSIIALMQIKLGSSSEDSMDVKMVLELYDDEVETTVSLLEKKNHDYGEAWRNMRVPSITDIILMKIERVKQIEDNRGNTIASEGVDANYRDMINYCVFALIMLKSNPDD